MLTVAEGIIAHPSDSRFHVPTRPHNSSYYVFVIHVIYSGRQRESFSGMGHNFRRYSESYYVSALLFRYRDSNTNNTEDYNWALAVSSEKQVLRTY